jgi:hypothetical protein
MTVEEIGDLYRRICAVTTKYTFTHPVDTSDIETVRAELAALVPEARVGVNPTERGDFVGVNVSVAGKHVYSRLMIVKGPS